jgi:integrase
LRLPVAGGRPRISDHDGHDHEWDEPARPPLKGVDLPAVRLQDLRHTCATILLMAGKHPEYVQELLGHASTSITLDTHSHVVGGMDGGFGNAMDEAL